MYKKNKNEIEIEYTQALIEEFMLTKFYNKKKRINSQVRGKEYTDFLIQKERNYVKLYNYLLYLKYTSDYDFGKILELNVGPDFNLANLNENDMFNITIISPYANKELFEGVNCDCYEGTLEYLSLVKEETIKIGNLYLKYNKDYKEKLKTLNDFDTIINVNPTNYLDILITYLYCRKFDKFCFTGYLSDYYDLTLNNKHETMNEVQDILTDEEVTSYSSIEEGSYVRVLTNL